MAKKVKSDSLVTAITVETPKVTDLNISRADLIGYVTAQTQKHYEDVNRSLTYELGQAVTKYLDREIARVNKIIQVIKKEAEESKISIDIPILNHKYLIDRFTRNILLAIYDNNFNIIRINNLSSYYLTAESSLITSLTIDGRFEKVNRYEGYTLTSISAISTKIKFENPTMEELINFRRLNTLIIENNEAASKVNDKSTKNSIISNMLEGSEKGKQMKESLHAIASSIRSELSESLKLTK